MAGTSKPFSFLPRKYISKNPIPQYISEDSLLENKDLTIAEILTNDQRVIVFDRRGGIFVEPSNVVVGSTPNGSIVRLNRDRVDFGYVDLPEPGTTFFLNFMGAPLLLIMFARLYYES